jgi:hypothetical protein
MKMVDYRERFLAEVEQCFVDLEYRFVVRDIQHGRQFVFPDGAILNVYGTGKFVWGGRAGPPKEQVGVEVTRIRGLFGPALAPSGKAYRLPEIGAEAIEACGGRREALQISLPRAQAMIEGRQRRPSDL